LTFVGSVFHLDRLEKLKARDPKSVRALAREYGEILEYPPFSEFQEIDRVLDGKGAETLCSIASLLLRGPGEPPQCDWNLMTFKHPRVTTFRAVWPKGEDEIQRLKRQQEELWMNEFAILLLTCGLPNYPPIWSPRLNSFYKRIFEQRKETMQRDLKKTTELLHSVDARVRATDRTDVKV
jgi:hypothetical protein